MNISFRRSFVTPSQAVALLKLRFPQLSQLFGPEDDSKTPQPFYAYERLAEEIQNRRDHVAFVESATLFMNELSRSKDPMLENLLAVSLLERLAVDPMVVRAIRPNLENEVLNLVTTVEREILGNPEDIKSQESDPIGTNSPQAAPVTTLKRHESCQAKEARKAGF